VIKLFLICTHGSANMLESKLVTRTLISCNNQPFTYIAAHYIHAEDRVVVYGSPLINQWLQDKSSWCVESTDDKFFVLKQLILKTKQHNALAQDEIGLLCEGNLTEPAGEEMPFIVLNLLNILQPAIAIFVSNTPRCNAFIDVWKQTYNLPQLTCLNKDNNSEIDTPEELRLKWTTKIKHLPPTCSPPCAIITLDKKLSGRCFNLILKGQYRIEDAPLTCALIKPIEQLTPQHTDSLQGKIPETCNSSFQSIFSASHSDPPIRPRTCIYPLFRSCFSKAAVKIIPEELIFKDSVKRGLRNSNTVLR
jgi:hypothetical protein